MDPRWLERKTWRWRFVSQRNLHLKGRSPWCLVTLAKNGGKKSFVPCRLPRDAFIFKIELSSFVCEENCFHHGSDKKYYRKQNCLHILFYSIILVVWEIFLLNFVKISHFNFSLKAFNCLRNSSDVFDLYFEFRALAS